MTAPGPNNPGQMIDYYNYTEFGSKNCSGGLNRVYLGIKNKQLNKVGTNDTTVPLRTPIPISFDIFSTRSYAC